MSKSPTLACINVGAPGYTPGQDYQQINCDFCGRPVWIGPQQLLLRAGGQSVCCCFCISKWQLEGRGPKVSYIPLNPHDSGSKVDQAALEEGLDAFIDADRRREKK